MHKIKTLLATLLAARDERRAARIRYDLAHHNKAERRRARRHEIRARGRRLYAAWLNATPADQDEAEIPAPFRFPLGSKDGPDLSTTRMREQLAGLELVRKEAAL